MDRHQRIFFVTLVTLARIPWMIAILYLDISTGGLADSWRVATLWFLVMLSDLLDGYFARRLDAETLFGERLDAFVDKGITVLALGDLVIYHALEPVYVVFLGAVVALGVWQSLLYKREMSVYPKSRKWGKYATLAWAMCALILYLGFPVFGNIFALLVAVVVTCIAFRDYALAYGWRWRVQRIG